MSKLVLFAGGLALAAGVVLAGAGVAYAAPQGAGRGPGGGGAGPGPGQGILAETMDGVHEQIADALGISVEEFEAARADGQTLAELAAAHEVELEDLWQMIEDARTDGIAQAVADGALTQEQADWMLAHVARRGGTGSGACDGTGPIVRSAKAFGGRSWR